MRLTDETITTLQEFVPEVDLRRMRVVTWKPLCWLPVILRMSAITFAPFVINSELKCMMVAHEHETEEDKETRIRDGKYIVNVSAMEGQFYRHKTHFHPHTNMAKASLNMLARVA